MSTWQILTQYHSSWATKGLIEEKLYATRSGRKHDIKRYHLNLELIFSVQVELEFRGPEGPNKIDMR